MLVLAFDTATAAVAVALHDGVRVLAESTTVDARRHAEVLAPAIVSVLRAAGAEPSDVTAIGTGAGPGPFTGLRVGLVTAVALGQVLGVPVHAACTLDVLARGGRLDGEFLVVTDAGRREVYWARYVGADRVEGPAVCRPAEVPRAGAPAVGAGALAHRDVFTDAREPAHPRAGVLAAMVVAGAGLLPPRPLYLRRPDAAVPGPRKPVLR